MKLHEDNYNSNLEEFEARRERFLHNMYADYPDAIECLSKVQDILLEEIDFLKKTEPYATTSIKELETAENVIHNLMFDYDTEGSYI